MIQKICEKLTGHRFRRLYAWDADFNGSNIEKHDFFYKCKICRLIYFNNCPTKKELDIIKGGKRK